MSICSLVTSIILQRRFGKVRKHEALWELENQSLTVHRRSIWLLRYYFVLFMANVCNMCRSQWPRGLRRRSTAARLLRLWVRIPPRAWLFVCCEWCVLSGRGLCDALITRPEESYQLWRVVVCDLETSGIRRRWPALGRSATREEEVCNMYTYKHTHKIHLLILRARCKFFDYVKIYTWKTRSYASKGFFYSSILRCFERCLTIRS